jgi:tRNA(Ile)-lysidine synthase
MDKLLLAVSGGVDSVALCELCKQADYDFEIAHCNFQLRGEESEEDEKFVKSLGEKYKVEVKVKKFNTEKFADENKMSIQEAARVLRYEWFEELVDGSGFGVSSHEHPTPDTGLPSFLLRPSRIMETVMNFCRGTGLHGLRVSCFLWKYQNEPFEVLQKMMMQFAKK